MKEFHLTNEEFHALAVAHKIAKYVTEATRNDRQLKAIHFSADRAETYLCDLLCDYEKLKKEQFNFMLNYSPAFFFT